MSKINIESVQNIISEVAEAIIMPRFGKLQEGDIAYKNPGDPVTIADKEAEIALSNRLSAMLPGSKVVGEEEFAANRGILDRIFGESPVWIIDPIDGTRAFMKGRPHFGVIVAIAERNHTVAGWLYDPTSKEFVTAEKGAGAWHQGKRLCVKRPASLPELTGVLGHAILKAHQDAGTDGASPQPQFSRVGYSCHEYARLSVEAPHFSRSKPQMHFRASQSYCTPWDDAAGVLIHQEAGGYSAHWDGEPFRPSAHNKGLLVAPDRESWQQLRDWIGGFCELETK